MFDHLLAEPLELLFVFRTAKVGGPGVANGKLVELQHVHDADLSHRTAKQLRPLVHTGRWGREHTPGQLKSSEDSFQDDSCSVRSISGHAPTSRPPFEPPFIVSLEGEVYPSLMRYSAAHWKSVKQFCLFASMPAKGKNETS